MVAMEFNLSKDTCGELFAATPPLEALRLIVSESTTGAEDKFVMISDVSRAYMYAKCDRELYVEIPEEDKTEEDRINDNVGKVEKAMYGTRPAAQLWQNEYTETLTENEFQVGKATPCIFRHDKRDLTCFVHGDDFVTAGRQEDLLWLDGVLKQKYDMKSQILGDRPGMHGEVRILNRTLRYIPGQGIEYEADARHSEILIDELARDKSPVSTPYVKDGTGFADSDDIKLADLDRMKRDGSLGAKRGKSMGELDKAGATTYRAHVARANYLAADRMDIIFAVKELSRAMSSPTTDDWDKLVRLARYLKGSPPHGDALPLPGVLHKSRGVHRHRLGWVQAYTTIDVWWLCSSREPLH